MGHSFYSKLLPLVREIRRHPNFPVLPFSPQNTVLDGPLHSQMPTELTSTGLKFLFERSQYNRNRFLHPL